MTAIAATMTGVPFARERREEKTKTTEEQSSMDEIINAMKFADQHNLEVVVEKLQPGNGVPFYWRFVRIV